MAYKQGLDVETLDSGTKPGFSRIAANPGSVKVLIRITDWVTWEPVQLNSTW
jgi:hypothetical protein